MPLWRMGMVCLSGRRDAVMPDVGRRTSDGVTLVVRCRDAGTGLVTFPQKAVKHKPGADWRNSQDVLPVFWHRARSAKFSGAVADAYCGGVMPGALSLEFSLQIRESAVLLY